MSTALDDAIRLVLADVAATTDLSLSARWEARNDGQVVVILGDEGFSIPTRAAGPHLIAVLASHAQDVVSEELASIRASNWPICPRHRSNHPLRADVRGTRAMWICSPDDVEVATVGSLRL